jgi:hypothetical protein
MGFMFNNLWFCLAFSHGDLNFVLCKILRWTVLLDTTIIDNNDWLASVNTSYYY